MDSIRLAAASQSTLLALLPSSALGARHSLAPPPSLLRGLRPFAATSAVFPILQIRVSSPSVRSRVVRAAAATTPVPVSETDLGQESLDVDIGGGGGGGSNSGGGSGGGGGGGNSNEGGQEGEGSEESKKTFGMSMSQKLTLGYAALVGVGGIMGYIKGGSQKSLVAGGLSALLLYVVYTQLPFRPAFASSLGLGLSAALLAVMGSRFKKSRKVFPAGVVSLVSFVMVGGYFHGILRSLH